MRTWSSGLSRVRSIHLCTRNPGSDDQQRPNAEAIISEKDLAQISSEDVIEGLVRDVLLNNPEQVQSYLGGKKSLQQWFSDR